jgi:hypothetical protein
MQTQTIQAPDGTKNAPCEEPMRHQITIDNASWRPRVEKGNKIDVKENKHIIKMYLPETQIMLLLPQRLQNFKERDTFDRVHHMNEDTFW